MAETASVLDTAQNYIGSSSAPGSLPDWAQDKKPDTDDSTSLLPTRQQYEGAKQNLTEILHHQISTEDANQARFDAQDRRNEARQERLIAAQGATADDLKPWNAQAELSRRQTSLWDNFGSPGFIIAMLGSAFSTMPMNAALESGGAAITALNQGKIDDYNRAYDAWKENTKLVIDRQNMEHQLYDELESLRTSDMAAWREKTAALAARFNDQRTLALLNNDMLPELWEARSAQAQAVKQLADASQTLQNADVRRRYIMLQPGVVSTDSKGNRRLDPQKFQEASQRWDSIGNAALTDYWKFVDEYRAANNGRDPSSTDIDNWLKTQSQIKYPMRSMTPANVAFEEFYQNYQATHNGQAPPPEAIMAFQQEQAAAKNAAGPPTRAKEIAKIQADIRAKNPKLSEAETYEQAAKQVAEANAPPVTGNQRVVQEEHIEQYNLAVDDLIPQIEDIIRRHVGAVGAAGYATRSAETIGNIVGSSETDRRQLQSDIEELQVMAPNLLLDRTTGRPLSAEHGAIDTIIRGLNFGDTSANTLRALDELKRRFTKLRDAAKGRIGEGSTPPATSPVPVALPEGDQPWLQDPIQ